MKYAIVENGKYTGIAYRQITPEVKEWLASNPTCSYVEVPSDFKVEKGKAPTKTVKSNTVRARRNDLINLVGPDLERYERQLRLGVETTHTESQYLLLLQYVEDLRNLPGKKGFPDVEMPEYPL